MASDEVDLIDGCERPVSEILRILAEGYGRPFGADWFKWKHRMGPWGPSRAIVARDAGGPLGVVFGLPWRFRVEGGPVDGIRLVDGATTPRAVRRGVFRRIVRELIDPTDGSARPPIVIATATPEAQGAHVKNGAVALEPIDAAYRPTLYSRAALETGPSVLDELAGVSIPRGVMTEWDAGSLRWRIQPSSGAAYHVARLAHSDSANGIIYRVGPRRTLIITTRWGSNRDRTALARAVAWRERATAVLAYSGPGTIEPAPRLGVRRGQSLLCVWDRTDRGSGSIGLGARPAWKLSGLDLEGSI